MAQLRIDRLVKVGSKVVANYTHALVGTVPVSAQGYGCAFQTAADLVTQVFALRDFLRQPEQLFLLSVLATLESNQLLPTPSAQQGRVITFTSTSTTSIFTAA